jgi:HlyD family secretion protein
MKPYIFLLGTGLVLMSCNNNAPFKDVKQGKLERDEMAIVGKIAGRIVEVRVSEGDYVKKGDTLAVLDIPELNAKKVQAKGAVLSAEAQYKMTRKGATDNQLKQLEAKKAALQEQFDFAEKSLNRLKAMIADSLAPQQQYDEVYAKYQGAKSQLIAVNAEIEDVKNGVRMEQQQMALGQQDRALGALQEVNVAEGEQYIIAQQDMIITTITLKMGELALPGYTLFKGSLPNSVYFRFTVPESQLTDYKLQQKVQVKVVYADKIVTGTIKNIKQTGAYANIASAYPDYEMQDILYDIIVIPDDKEAVKDFISKTTAILQ